MTDGCWRQTYMRPPIEQPLAVVLRKLRVER
jgi:hypothetical protein